MINQKAVNQSDQNSKQKRTPETETLVQIAPKRRHSTISDDEMVSLKGSDVDIIDLVERFDLENL